MVDKFEVGKKYKHSQVRDQIATCIAITSARSTPILEWESGSITIPSHEGLHSYWSEYKEPKRGTVWVNIYGYPNRGMSAYSGLAHTTKEEADNRSDGGRIACVEVPWVEGQGLE